MYKFEITSHSLDDLRMQINSYAGELNELFSSAIQLQLKPQETFAIPNFAPQVAKLQESIAQVAAPNVDLKGQPFDENLHSSSRKFNQDGSWKARRGTVSSTPVAAPTVAPVTPVAAPMVPVAPPVVAAPVVAPPAVINKLAHNLESFRATLPMVFATLITEGKIKQDYVNQLCAHFKVDQIWQVQKDEMGCAQLFTLFVNHGFITKVD